MKKISRDKANVVEFGAHLKPEFSTVSDSHPVAVAAAVSI